MTAPAERARIDSPPVPANKYALPRASLRFLPRLERESDHPTAWEFPSVLCDEPAWLAELRRLYADPLCFPASLSPQAGLLLHALVLNVRPRVVVETGSFLGASTLWMGGAIAESSKLKAQRSSQAREAPAGLSPSLHCFDDFGPIKPGPWRGGGFEGDRLSLVRERVARAGLGERVTLYRGDSATELVRARDGLKQLGGVDVAFLDGDHTVEGATRDLWAVEPVLNTGGYVVLHDTLPEQCGGHAGPRHVVDRINAITQGLYEACELHLAPLNYGLAVLRRIG
ncbi:MAG: O-methyltransferase [Phycisphaerales bacterium]